MQLDGRKMWITGASSGIGEALALAASRRGARLVLSARRAEVLEQVRDRCEGSPHHQVVAVDLADGDGIRRAAEEVLADGPVDIVVHCGGVSQRALAQDTREEVDRKLFEVNYFGTVALTKALLPAMLERGRGHFVVVSSLVGKIGTPLRSSYAAAKHALHGFFDSLRAEVWDQGLRVTIICPGFIRTRVSHNALTGDGSPQGTLDRAQANGMAPEACAAEILRAIEGEKSEVLIGGRERWAVHLKRFLPGTFERVIRKARVT
ncbi:MAG: SDR family oxidoreductase [Acidobacteriota bacterium]